MPEIDTLFNVNNNFTKGLHCADNCWFRVNSGKGFINSTENNIEVRSSMGTAIGCVVTGAGDTGLRVQRNTKIRATGTIADNCGRVGIEISRGSIAEIQDSSAKNCGHTYNALFPGFINQGGLCVRRAFVAADPIDCSGSTRGISTQLAAYVNANDSNFSNCTLTGVRGTSGSIINAGNSNLTNCGIGVSAGNSSRIVANNADFTGCANVWNTFGGQAYIDVTDATRPNNGSLPLNSPFAEGYIIDANLDLPLVTKALKSYEFTLNDDTADAFTPLGTGGDRMVLFSISTSTTIEQGIYALRVTNTAADAVVPAAIYNPMTTLVAMTGTTGPDNFVNLAADSSGGGKIWVENRSGFTKTFIITILSNTI
jgi:hypothetical protein